MALLPHPCGRRAPARLALTSVKTAVVAGVLVVLAAAGAPGTPERSEVDQGLARAADRPACAGALIRTTQGTVRRVSFRVGWDVYTGRRPGTLIAACLEANEGG